MTLAGPKSSGGGAPPRRRRLKAIEFQPEPLRSAASYVEETILLDVIKGLDLGDLGDLGRLGATSEHATRHRRAWRWKQAVAPLLH